MGLCIWLVALFTLSSAIEDEEEALINDYLDGILRNLKNNTELVSKFDPLKLPDYNAGSKLRITDMVLRGLSGIHRSGDSVISHKNGTVVARAHLAVNDIHLDAKYAVHVVIGWLRGEIAATQSRMAVKITIAVDVETRAKKVEEFKVTEFGKLTVTKATGLQLFKWLLKGIAQILVDAYKQEIVEALERNAMGAIEQVIGEIDFPLGR